MSFKVLLILLSSATISQCSEVCLCCNKQVISQNLTDCQDIARPATMQERDFLRDYCYQQDNKISYSDNRLITIQQFDADSLSAIKLPERHCDEVFNNMEGLLYIVKESDSTMFNKLMTWSNCFAALQKSNNGYKKTVPGVVCPQRSRDQIERTFKPLNYEYKLETSNITRYIYFIRQPVSYKMTNMLSDNDNYWLSGCEDITLGKVSVCEKEGININSTITVKYEAETVLNFIPFYKLYSNLIGNIYNLKPVSFELTDSNNKTRLVPFNSYDNNVHYMAHKEDTISFVNPFPSHLCGSAIIYGKIESRIKKVDATFEINLGSIGNFKDHVEIKRQLEIQDTVVSFVGFGHVIVSGYRDTIIIPYTTGILLLGCIAGMILFGLLLLIMIKGARLFEIRGLKKNWARTSEHLNHGWIIVSTFTQEKGAILGDRLVRLGDYICNVGTWIYQEIK